jgi:import inner membrane translocase subunit TIM44
VITFRTQEILAFRDLATGEIAQGQEDKIETVGYVAVMTRIEEELEDETTGGWKIIDVSLLVHDVLAPYHDRLEHDK